MGSTSPAPRLSVAGTRPRVLLISPVRNEAAHLGQVAGALVSQRFPPDLWLVVDDGSTDGTAELLDELVEQIPFMRVVRTPPGYTRDDGDRNSAGGPDRAFNFGLEHVDWRSFTHVGKLDGDIVLPSHYLEALLERFGAEPSLGVAGGVVMEPADGGWREMRTPRDHATAPARIYSRECFEAIGGMPPRMGADLITTMLAQMRGYRTRTFPEVPVRHLRPMGAADGLRRGRMRAGAYQYLVHYHPAWMLLRSVLVAFRFRPYGLSGWWFLLGYLRAVFGPTRPVDDPQLRAYVRQEQRARVKAVLTRRLRPGGTPAAESSASRPERARAVARTLEAHGHGRDWLGPDPYEGMNATRLVGPLKRSALGRRLLLQAVKRSPLDLRPLLGIRPTPNSATAAFVVSAYTRGGFLPPEEADSKLRAALARLVGLRSPQWEDPCWGYQFGTQSRLFFYDRYEPSVVATTFAATALLDAYERLHDRELLELADGAARFFMRNIPQTADPPGAFFGYLVGDRTPIHNSNLHASAVLARVGRLLGNDEYLSAAQDGVEWSLARQRADGSWPYGELPNLRWVDNFHTGYVLDSLLTCAECGVHDGIEEAWRRGLAYWRRELFLPDGTPKYFDHAIHPIDGQCVSQAIQTFALASRRDPSCLEDAWRTFDWALEHMRRRDGLFLFQRRRFWVNPTPHVRWVQAPMLLALTQLLEAERDRVS